MPISARVDTTVTSQGVPYVSTVTVSADKSISLDVNAPGKAADAGTLSTRTDNTTGTFTMTTGHGINTADRADVYWTVGGVNGSRQGVVIGTVSVNSVPFSGGTGDNLPVVNSVVVVKTAQNEAVALTGADAVAILFKATNRSIITLTTSVPANVLNIVLPAGGVYAWYSGNGVTNPITGSTIARCYVSQDGLAPANIVGTLLYN